LKLRIETFTYKFKFEFQKLNFNLFSEFGFVGNLTTWKPLYGVKKL